MSLTAVLAALLVAWCVLQAQAAPFRQRESQACGDRLAELLSLVCSGRGYNVAFRPEQNAGRRFRRGIVEECCHRSCSFAVLQLYCREDPAEPSDPQIRKRSDTEAFSSERSEDGNYPRYNSQVNTGDITPRGNTIDTMPVRDGEENYKIINLLSPSFKNSKNDIEIPMISDSTEDQSQSLPALRHRKKHHHRSRMLRARHNSAKAKRDQKSSEESTQTFQIGTVKPYFMRPSIPYRSNSIPSMAERQ